MSDGFCCQAAAARAVGRITVDRMEVGIAHLERILEEVSASGIAEEGLRDELLRVARIYNYIPRSKWDRYADGLMAAYGGRE
jgi:hypothetical protein